MQANHDQPKSYGHASEDARTAHPGASAGLWPRLRSAALLVVVGTGLAWLALNHPLASDLTPRCPTEQFMGFYCPGCGSTRATHHLLNARPGVAMSYNPALVLVGLPLGAWYLARTGIFVATGRRLKIPGIPGWAGWAALVLLLSFTLARNLPMTWAQALRPTPVEQDRALYQQQHPQADEKAEP